MMTVEKLRELKNYMILKRLAERAGVNYHTLKHRLYVGRATPPEDAEALTRAFEELLNEMAKIVYGPQARVEIKGKRRRGRRLAVRT